jgi:STIP1 family protein 1
MHDPVITPSGFTYERSWIERWVTSNDRDPLDRNAVTVAQLVPNRSLRAAIERYKANEEFMIVPW